MLSFVYKQIEGNSKPTKASTTFTTHFTFSCKMNTLTITNSPRLSTLSWLGLPEDTDLAVLGKLHGSAGEQPIYPQYIEYYQAWSDSYRDFLLSKSSPSNLPF